MSELVRRPAYTGIFSACLIVNMAAAQARRTVWDGVYSTAQATRGQTAYASTCARCHGPALEGDEAPSLVGDTFMRSWGEDSVGHLFAKVDAMPPKTPPSRTKEANADLVAYLLQANHFPAGAEDLRTSAGALETITIIEKDGQGIPNFSLVRVVGCLTQGPASAWVLTRTSDPVRTRNPAASKDDELKDSQAKALGTGTFTLLSLYPSPDVHKGHRIEVKGFLIRIPYDDRINVSSLERLGPTCGE